METNYAKRSLEGLWVGDCIGNLGQLYFVHDILKALEDGMAKFGGTLNQFNKQFQYSDDTEEAIVLYNHIHTNKKIIQDKLAMEFATRYMERDPDGEIYGYGLNTRKVLRDIYEGTPWNDANKFIKKSEGMPSHIDSLVGSLSQGKDFKAAMHEVNLVLERQKKGEEGKELQGSCGNGSAMRVAPLGAYLAINAPRGTDHYAGDETLHDYEKKIIAEAALQAEPTHCHPEGMAGAIAITSLAHNITEAMLDGMISTHTLIDVLYANLLKRVPAGQVKDGIIRSMTLPFNTPLMKAIEVLGNGQHVTCQDTVPVCCWLTIKALTTYPLETMYETAIIETSKIFGDVDTNCAIVGGMIGIVSPVPEKWVKFCQPMEGVIGDIIPEKNTKSSPMAAEFQRRAGIVC